MANQTLVRIPAAAQQLDGDLAVPVDARAIVVFAHGSGSSRTSPRNRLVAERLQAARLGTLLFDLLTEDEDRDYQRRFDIGLLTRRLRAAADWAASDAHTEGLPIVLFGASTGAASALQVAAEMGPEIAVVISRGGRVDLAGEKALRAVVSPTLMIVGGDDEQVIALNQQAYDQMQGDRELRIVEGATHLFEEPGALEEVADLAVEFTIQHIGGVGYMERDLEPL